MDLKVRATKFQGNGEAVLQGETENGGTTRCGEDQGENGPWFTIF